MRRPRRAQYPCDAIDLLDELELVESVARRKFDIALVRRSLVRNILMVCSRRREHTMPKFSYARPRQAAGEERTMYKLAHARHAPADWIQQARMIALSWEGRARSGHRCADCSAPSRRAFTFWVPR
jgi:hypothetical protein